MSGKLTVLHNFAGGPTDGESPTYTALLMDKEGNLYGLTALGGAYSAGVVYKLSANGTYTVLHSFAGGTKDGCYPLGTPAMDEKGNLYGTAMQCGSYGQGIVWKLSKKGTETVLHNFDHVARQSGDGEYPEAGVILDHAGDLYGTTCAGGEWRSSGSLFELTAAGTWTVLHEFIVEEGGFCPEAGLILDAKGNLYSTVPEFEHTDNDYGDVWEYTPLMTMARVK